MFENADHEEADNKDTMSVDYDTAILEDEAVGEVESRNVHKEHKCVSIVSRMQEKYSAETADTREETTDERELCRRNTGRAKANWCQKGECVSHTGESYQRLLQWAQRKTQGRLLNQQNCEPFVTAFGSTPFTCRNIVKKVTSSGFEEVPQRVRDWIEDLWGDHALPREWWTKTVAAVSLEELTKGEVLDSSKFVHITYGELTWKAQRTGIFCGQFWMCKLKGSTGHVVLFLIFQNRAMKTIESAPMGSSIGLFGLGTGQKKIHSNRAYIISDRYPGEVTVLRDEVTVLQTKGKGGRPRGSGDKAKLTDLSSLPWSVHIVNLSQMSCKDARILAKQLTDKYALHRLPRAQQPSFPNIWSLWKSLDGDTCRRAPPKSQKQFKPHRQKGRSVCTSEIQENASGPNDMQDGESSVVDLAPTILTDEEFRETNLRGAYADYLTHKWLRESKHLCPVYKDTDTVVFCIPSWKECRDTGKMIYDEQEPIFIHIGQFHNKKCAVVCSKCDKLPGFWPKSHFRGIQVREKSLGFQMPERHGRTAPTEPFKPLCVCAFALLSIPSKKCNRTPTSTDMWEVAQSLHGELYRENTGWPVSEISELEGGDEETRTNTFRQHPKGWLIQVGAIGSRSCGFVKQITRGPNSVTVFRCKTCPGHAQCHHEIRLGTCVSARLGGTVNVKGGHTAESFQQVLNDYTIGGTQGPVDLKLKVMSKKAIPDVPETVVARLLNPTLIPLDSQILYTLNEKNKYNTHQTKAINRRKPWGGPWVPAEGLTDLLTGETLSEGGDKRTYKTAALFHTGGVVAAKIDCPYDGNNDAVMNVDDKYLFTWELIRKYLRELRLQPTNYSRFVNSMEETWEGCIDMCETLRKMFPVVLQSSTSSTDPLKQITTKFSHAVHGYITLLNIDWPDLFRCRCIFEDDRKGTIVYDNACNLVIFIQNREPSFFKNYSLQCDNFHHEHGGSGKGHRNCGPGTNMINAGLHTPGTYSGNVIEQKNSRVRTLEALVSSECQPRMMNTARYWHGQENKLQMVRLQLEKYQKGQMDDLQRTKPSKLIGVDGINLPQGGKHSYLCRPYENPAEDCEWRWHNPVSSDRRQMIGPLHKEALSSMLDVTSNNDFVEFKWAQKHQELVEHLKEQNREAVLWLIRLEKKDPTKRAAKSKHPSFEQTEEFWEPVKLDDLHAIKFDTQVRLSSHCKLVRNVFENWCARNPELQFAFPTYSVALKEMLTKDTCTLEELAVVRQESGQHVREIVDFDLNHPNKVSPGAHHSEQSLSTECRTLLQLIVKIVDDSLKSTRTKILPRHTPTVKQCLNNPESDSWLVTGEWFPNNPVRKRAGKFLSTKRYLDDEKKDGSPKSVKQISKSCVCHKKVYAHNNLKPGLMTVHCMYCCVNVGFTFLDQPETVRTCFKLFWHREMVKFDSPDEDIITDEEVIPNERETDDEDAPVEEVAAESSEELSYTESTSSADDDILELLSGTHIDAEAT